MMAARLGLIGVCMLIVPAGLTAQPASFPNFGGIENDSEELLALQGSTGFLRNLINCALEYGSGENDWRQPCQFLENLIALCGRDPSSLGGFCEARPTLIEMYAAARRSGDPPRRGLIQWEGRRVQVNSEAALPLHAQVVAMTVTSHLVSRPRLLYSAGRRVGGVDVLEWGAKIDQAILAWGIPAPNSSEVIDGERRISYRTSRVVSPRGLEGHPLGLLTLFFDHSGGLFQGEYSFPFGSLQGCEAIYRDLREEVMGLLGEVPMVEAPTEDLNPIFCPGERDKRAAQFSEWKDDVGGTARLSIRGSAVLLRWEGGG